MRVFITGLNGFAGSHLADFLLTQPDSEIYGAGIGPVDNIAHLNGRVNFAQVDLTQPDATAAVLEKTKPDRVYHLAGQAFAPISWADPWGTIEINLRAQVNVLNTLARMKSDARVLVIGSIDEYGRVDSQNLPVKETAPFNPDSPYAVSKIAQDFLGLQYFLSDELHVVRARPSNHIGPRQNEQFVTSNFAKQIAEVFQNLGRQRRRAGNEETHKPANFARGAGIHTQQPDINGRYAKEERGPEIQKLRGGRR